jgi:hypothetical protein
MVIARRVCSRFSRSAQRMLLRVLIRCQRVSDIPCGDARFSQRENRARCPRSLPAGHIRALPGRARSVGQRPSGNIGNPLPCRETASFGAIAELGSRTAKRVCSRFSRSAQRMLLRVSRRCQRVSDIPCGDARSSRRENSQRLSWFVGKLFQKAPGFDFFLGCVII